MPGYQIYESTSSPPPGVNDENVGNENNGVVSTERADEAEPQAAASENESQVERVTTGNAEADEFVAERREKTCDFIDKNRVYESVGKMIANLCGMPEEDRAGTMSLATEQCKKYLGMSETKAEELVNEAEIFLSKITVKIENVEISEDAVTCAKSMLCEPILRDNISATAVLKMASELVIKPLDDMKRMSEIGQGYEGVMYCDPRSGKITVAAEALTGEYRDESGKEIKLNARHMLGHEMAHSVVEDVFFQEESESNAEAMSFVQEVINLAQTAKADRIPLPIHIENELEVLANLPLQYDKIPATPEGEKISFDNFKRWRESKAAREILTDLTACYLQSNRLSSESNGSEERGVDGFMAECVDNIGALRMYEFLQGSGNSEAEQRVEEYFSLPKEDRANKGKIIEVFPELQTASNVYSRFYKIAQRYLGKENIDLAAGQGAIRGLSDGEFDGDMHYDPYGSFAQQSNAGGPQSNEESVGRAGLGLLQAFAEEVAKPVNAVAT